MAGTSGSDKPTPDSPDTPDTPEKPDTPESADGPVDLTKSGATSASPRGKKRPVSRVSTLRVNPDAPRPSTPGTAAPGQDASGRTVVGKGRPIVAGRTHSGPAVQSAPVPAADASTTEDSGPGWTLAIIGAAVAAVLAIIAVVGGLHPGASDRVEGDDVAFLDQPATTELLAQADAKLCVMFAVDNADFDGWAQRSRDVLAGEALAEFEEYLPEQRELIEQAQMTADCRVEYLGVGNLDVGPEGARASVLANLIVSEARGGQISDSGAPRVEFGMVRDGDQWLIEKVEPF